MTKFKRGNYKNMKTTVEIENDIILGKDYSNLKRGIAFFFNCFNILFLLLQFYGGYFY